MPKKLGKPLPAVADVVSPPSDVDSLWSDLTDALVASVPTLKEAWETEEHLVEEIRQQVQPIINNLADRRLTRHEMCQLLDAGIRLEWHSSTIGGSARALGREVGQTLLLAVFGWTVGVGQPSKSQLSVDAELSIKDYRDRLAASLLQDIGLIKTDDRIRIAQALLDLNDGTGRLPQVFSPHRSGRTTADPESVFFNEEMIILWHSWRTGQLRKHGAAELAWAEIQPFYGSDSGKNQGSAKAGIRKWLERAWERNGRDAFNAQMHLYKEKGRSGEPFSENGFTLEGLFAARVRAKNKFGSRKAARARR
jgi:hypothetical protein